MVTGEIWDLKQFRWDFNRVKIISKKFIDIIFEKLEQLLHICDV